MNANLSSLWATFSGGLTVLLLFLLPFEAIRPVRTIAGLQFTNLEIMLAMTLAAGVVNVLVNRRQLPGRAGLVRLLWPAGALFLVALLSAWLATGNQLPAMKSTLRLGAGIVLMVVVWSQTGRPGRFTTFATAIVAGAAVTALLGLLERASWPALDPFFLLFKARETFVGGQVRVSGSFQYATIAAMYWEMALPLALVLVVSAGRSRPGRWLAQGAAWLIVTAIVLSLTRAGLIVLLFSLLVLLILSRFRSRFRPLWRPAGLTALYLAGLLLFLVVANRSFRARLVTANDLDWFDAVYLAPETMEITSGESGTTTVQVTNVGRVDWSTFGAHPFVLGYRWLNAAGDQVYDLPTETFPLPAKVLPGESVTLLPAVTAPLPAGTYRLAWGMVHKDVLPFFARGVPDAETVVTVRPGTETFTMPPATPLNPLNLPELGPDIVSRPELWLAAGRMAGERPVFGHGLNNYRFIYGAYIGRESWDMRSSANNLYLELLADVGLVGVLAAGWLGVAAATLLWQSRRTLWALGLAISLGAVLVHGLLDYFFEFLSVLLLFWVLVGLTAALTDREPTAL
jgi:hypothetical protein